MSFEYRRKSEPPSTNSVHIRLYPFHRNSKILNLHPKIVVADGSMSANKKYRGKMEKVIMDYVKDMEDELKEADSQRVFMTHSGCEQGMVDKVYTYLQDLNHFDEIIITRAGGVISSHCGPGTLGILYLKS